MKKYEIFPLVEFEKQTGSMPFEINSIQFIREHGNEKELQLHRNKYFEMIWITAGETIFLVDMEKIILKANQIVFVKPGQVHQFIYDEHTQGFIICFSESFLNLGEYEFDFDCQTQLFEMFAGSKKILINNETKKEMEEVIRKMMKEFETHCTFRSQVLRRYLKIFLIYLARQFEQNDIAVKRTRNMELVQRFMNSLDKNFKEKKMVADYAIQLSVTPNYLNEIVKKNTGYPAGYHIRQRIVLEAKRLATYSDLCMKEIAYSLDFNDCAHFSKFFKTVTGGNFTDFKRERENNYAA